MRSQLIICSCVENVLDGNKKFGLLEGRKILLFLLEQRDQKRGHRRQKKSKEKMRGTKGNYRLLFFLSGKEKKTRQSGELWRRQAEERERSSSSTLPHYGSIELALA